MDHVIENMNLFFDSNISACREKEQLLISDERRDEANFEKIRANIFDIFKTVLNAAQKSCGEDMEKVKAFFAGKIETIPSGWKMEFEKAGQHGDTAKQRIEEIKLKAAEEIKEEFLRVWG